MSANPFPDLPPDEYDALLADIGKRGIVYPVIRDQNGQTIDGHQRERAAEALGIVPHYRIIHVASEAERLSLAIALNAYRRQLTPDERRDAILRLASTGMTQGEIGAAVGVDQSNVSRTIAAHPEVMQAHNPEGLTTGAYAIDKQGRPPEQRGGRPRADAPVRAGVERPLTVRVMLTLYRLDTKEQRTLTIGDAPAAIPAQLRDAAFDLATRLLREEPEEDEEYAPEPGEVTAAGVEE